MGLGSWIQRSRSVRTYAQLWDHASVGGTYSKSREFLLALGRVRCHSVRGTGCQGCSPVWLDAVGTATRAHTKSLQNYSCVVLNEIPFCQSAPSHHAIKSACKPFENVLVQNNLFGLSPSLTEAIQSVPRWRFIQASFPHVMHCAASLLYNRRDNNLGPAEKKLLYTLHWILLDAAEECADADNEKGATQTPSYYLFSVTGIQVFIYLFAPLLHNLQESDFQNWRLENGLKIWGALWEYRHPDVPAFTSPVRPRRTVLRARKMRRSNTQFGDVFLGSGAVAFSSSSQTSDEHEQQAFCFISILQTSSHESKTYFSRVDFSPSTARRRALR
ncbi:protein unc-80 homolog [Oratosquilla oratoria]|uniref:protein unc-80 homolog n=1 Tax=Oratosquilla oratoria TaxID=337810 RepID=UPI003F776BB4